MCLKEGLDKSLFKLDGDVLYRIMTPVLYLHILKLFLIPKSKVDNKLFGIMATFNPDRFAPISVQSSK